MVWFICLHPCSKEDLGTEGNAYLQQYFRQMKKRTGKEKNGQIRLPEVRRRCTCGVGKLRREARVMQGRQSSNGRSGGSWEEKRRKPRKPQAPACRGGRAGRAQSRGGGEERRGREDWNQRSWKTQAPEGNGPRPRARRVRGAGAGQARGQGSDSAGWRGGGRWGTEWGQSPPSRATGRRWRDRHVGGCTSVPVPGELLLLRLGNTVRPGSGILPKGNSLHSAQNAGPA